MVDIFASSKHPSLFPNVIPCPDISPEEYHLFYKQERHLFTVLLVILHREAVQSILVMGFLIWLEREGYTSKNLVQSIISSLAPDAINLIADDVVVCLKFLQKKRNNFMSARSSGGYDISLLQGFLDRKSINLMELHENQDQIFDEVTGIARDVSGKAFEDIMQHFIWRGGPLVLASPAVGGNTRDYRYIGPVVPFPSYDISTYVGFYPTSGSRGVNSAFVTPMIDFRQQRDLGLNQRYVVREQEPQVPPLDRTIFLTFSKGYPVSECEARNFFTGMFGDFIEDIYMKEVEPEEQVLYARIVSRSLAMVSVIVDRDGANGISKYYINGKHVWARKFVRRSRARAATEVTEPPPRWMDNWKV